MLSNLALAQLALESYDRATHECGNSAAFVTHRPDCIVIAFRGTNDPIDILADLWAIPWKPNEVGAWVHRGFWLYLKPLVEPLMQEIRNSRLPVELVGHSLGGAAACIFAAICLRHELMVQGLTTFGAPRPGYDSLANIIHQIPGRRFVVEGDQVTDVPPSWFAFPYVHHKIESELPGKDGFIDHPMQGYVEALLAQSSA